AAVLGSGAVLVDVKEPARGSLGRADDDVLSEVKAVVAEQLPISAGLGELRDGLDLPELNGIAFANWGLAGCLSLPWRDLLRRARPVMESPGACRLVVTAYVDWRRADAPAPLDVCHFAAHEQSAALLVDTWHKDGSTLLDWLSSAEVAELVQHCQ